MKPVTLRTPCGLVRFDRAGVGHPLYKTSRAMPPPARTARPEENPRKPAKPLPGQLDLLAGLTARNAAVVEAIARIEPAAPAPRPSARAVSTTVAYAGGFIESTPVRAPASPPSKLDARIDAMALVVRRAEAIGAKLGAPFDATPGMTQLPTGPAVSLRVTRLPAPREARMDPPRMLDNAYLEARLRGHDTRGLEPMSGEWRAVTGAIAKALRDEGVLLDGKPVRVVYEITPAALAQRAAYESPIAEAAGIITPSAEAGRAQLEDQIRAHVESYPLAGFSPQGRAAAVRINERGVEISLKKWPRSKARPSFFGPGARATLEKGGAIYEGEMYEGDAPVLTPSASQALADLRASVALSFGPRLLPHLDPAVRAVARTGADTVFVAFDRSAYDAEAKRLGGHYIPKRR